MNYVWYAIVMKVSYTPSSTQCYPIPRIPIQYLLVPQLPYTVILQLRKNPYAIAWNIAERRLIFIVLATVQVWVQTSIGHEFIDQKIEIWCCIIPMEGDYISVLYVTHSIKFPFEAFVSVGGAFVQFLHCEYHRIGDAELVNCAIAAGTNDVPVGKLHRLLHKALRCQRLNQWRSEQDNLSS